MPIAATSTSATSAGSGPLTRTQGVSVLVPPTDRPVTWAELKAQQKVATDIEQVFGERCIDAAAEYVEARLSCYMMPRTLLATFYAGRAQLPRGPILQVMAVTDRYDNAIASYEIEHVGNTAIVVPTAGYTYPISVTFRAGYSSAAAIPAMHRHVVGAFAGAMFENREANAERARTTHPHIEDFFRFNSRKACVA